MTDIASNVRVFYSVFCANKQTNKQTHTYGRDFECTYVGVRYAL
jgi:hypothetical protein